MGAAPDADVPAESSLLNSQGLFFHSCWNAHRLSRSCFWQHKSALARPPPQTVLAAP